MSAYHWQILQRHVPRLDLGEVQEIIDQRHQAARSGQQRANVLALSLAKLCILLKPGQEKKRLGVKGRPM
jgi:hypothetical protein